MTAAPYPRIVVDTNIFAPAIRATHKVPPVRTAGAGLLEAWRRRWCTLVVSPELLAEYLDVLQRDEFRLSYKEADRVCRGIARTAVVVSPPASQPLLTLDPGDDIVLKTAIEGGADFLVTDNTRHFAEIAKLKGGSPGLRYRGVTVVGLSRVLDAIRATHAQARTTLPRR